MFCVCVCVCVCACAFCWALRIKLTFNWHSCVCVCVYIVTHQAGMSTQAFGLKFTTHAHHMIIHPLTVCTSVQTDAYTEIWTHMLKHLDNKHTLTHTHTHTHTHTANLSAWVRACVWRKWVFCGFPVCQGTDEVFSKAGSAVASFLSSIFLFLTILYCSHVNATTLTVERFHCEIDVVYCILIDLQDLLKVPV